MTYFLCPIMCLHPTLVKLRWDVHIAIASVAVFNYKYVLGTQWTFQPIEMDVSKGFSRMRAPLAAPRAPAGNQNKAVKCAICFWT